MYVLMFLYQNKLSVLSAGGEKIPYLPSLSNEKEKSSYKGYEKHMIETQYSKNVGGCSANKFQKS